MIKHLSAGLLAISLSATAGLSHAEMYKWVDDKGVTHYTDNPDLAGKSSAAQLKPNAAPAPAAGSGQSWQEREVEYRRRQMMKPQEPVAQRSVPKQVNPKRPYYSDEVATDASRCELARDILSGAAVHMSGRKVDQHERDVAKNDVSNFCH